MVLMYNNLENNLEKDVLFAISSYNKKFYFSEISNSLPTEIKNEIKNIGFYFVSKLSGIFSFGFYKNGDFFIQSSCVESDINYDEIGVKLEIEQFKKEKKELIYSLKLWYKILLNKRGDISARS